MIKKPLLRTRYHTICSNRTAIEPITRTYTDVFQALRCHIYFQSSATLHACARRNVAVGNRRSERRGSWILVPTSDEAYFKPVYGEPLDRVSHSVRLGKARSRAEISRNYGSRRRVNARFAIVAASGSRARRDGGKAAWNRSDGNQKCNALLQLGCCAV